MSRRLTQERGRSRLLRFTTRRLRGRISQYCRAPRDFAFLSRASFAAAVGRPNGVSSPLSSLQGSMSRTNTILLFVTKSLLEARPPNPGNMILGRNLRHGDDTFASHPVVTFRISSPDSGISPPASEYILAKPSRSPTLTIGCAFPPGSISRHQQQRWDRRIKRVFESCQISEDIQESNQSVFGVVLQAEDGIRDFTVTGVRTCALPI